MIHSYTSGWQGANIVSDPPVPGAIEFIERALGSFRVAIFSSRSNQDGGITAMRAFVYEHWVLGDLLFNKIEWPTEKPSAFLTIDDRALTFDGTWPDVNALLDFKPWNKK